MTKKQDGQRPYAKWSKDPPSRWVDAGNTFGRHLMTSARDYAFGRIPQGTSAKTREVAEKAALDAIYGMMMLLDGIPRNDIDANHRIEYALEARIIDRRSGDEPVERFELAPEGDGLCIGYHGWVGGNFGA
jgi:hypothetical protein